MSRSRECTRCAELNGELRQWIQDYKDLARSMAEGQGYASSQADFAHILNTAAAASAPGSQPFSAEPALPGNIFTAIEDTTDRSSEPRRMAIEWARGALDSGMEPEQVEAQLRHGEEIKI